MDINTITYFLMADLVIICLYHRHGTSMDLQQMDLTRMDKREYFMSLCKVITMTFGCCLFEPIYGWDMLKKKFKTRGQRLTIRGDFNEIRVALEQFKQKVEKKMTNIFGPAEMALLHELEETMKRLNEYLGETDICIRSSDAYPNKVLYFDRLVEAYKSTNRSEWPCRDRDFERRIYRLHATLTCEHKYTYSRFMYYNYIMNQCMTIGTTVRPQMSKVVVTENDEHYIINHQEHALLTDLGVMGECMAP